MKKQRIRFLNLWIIACILLSAAGCGPLNQSAPDQKKMQVEDSRSVKKTETADGPRGRFVDIDLPIPDDLSAYLGLSILGDGSIMLIGADSDCKPVAYIEQDGVWNRQDMFPDTLLSEGEGAHSAAADKDGTVYLAIGTFIGDVNDIRGVLRYVKVSLDGRTEEIRIKELEEAAEENGAYAELLPDESPMLHGISDLMITDSGDLLGQVSHDYAIYQIDTTSYEVKNTYELTGSSDTQTAGDNLYILYDTGLEIINLNTGKSEGNVEAFEQYSGKPANGNYEAGRYTTGSDSDTLYMAIPDGLYRYKAGSNLAEQLIDGSLCSLSDTSFTLDQIHYINDENFLFIFYDFSNEFGKKIVKSSYDTSVLTEPSKTITLYSLDDYYMIPKIITRYQKLNPDVHVIYQVGMDGMEEENRSDVIKNLNTEILAGTGPDILILDELPYESYKENGALADISPALDPLLKNGELYEKIINSYEYNGEITMAPLTFKVPVMNADKSMINNVTDMDSILAYLKKEFVADGQLWSATYSWSPSVLTYRLSSVFYNTWLMNNKQLDETGLKKFLEQCKEIIDMNDQAGEASKTIFHDLAGDDIIDYELEIDYTEDWICIAADFLDEKQVLLNLGTIRDLNDMGALYLQNNRNSWNLLNPEINYFEPYQLIGLNAKSADPKTSLDFIAFAFGEEGQNVELPSQGISLNKNALAQKYQDILKENEHRDDFDKLFCPDQKTFEEFQELFETLDTPVLYDALIYQTIIEQAIPYYYGKQDVDQAVSEIAKKVNLYLAE